MRATATRVCSPSLRNLGVASNACGNRWPWPRIRPQPPRWPLSTDCTSSQSDPYRASPPSCGHLQAASRSTLAPIWGFTTRDWTQFAGESQVAHLTVMFKSGFQCRRWRSSPFLTSGKKAKAQSLKSALWRGSPNLSFKPTWTTHLCFAYSHFVWPRRLNSNVRRFALSTENRCRFLLRVHRHPVALSRATPHPRSRPLTLSRATSLPASRRTLRNGAQVGRPHGGLATAVAGMRAPGFAPSAVRFPSSRGRFGSFPRNRGTGPRLDNGPIPGYA